MKMFGFNSAPDSDQNQESIGLTNVPMYLAKADRGIKATTKFIEDLQKLLENTNATEEKRAKWNKDILEARITLAQLQTEQAELLEDAANEETIEEGMKAA